MEISRRNLGGLAAFLGLSASGLTIEPVLSKPKPQVDRVPAINRNGGPFKLIQCGCTRVQLYNRNEKIELDFFLDLPIVGRRMCVICEEDGKLFTVTGIETAKADEIKTPTFVTLRPPSVTKIGAIYLSPTGIENVFAY